MKQIDDLECFEYFEMLPEEIIIYISIYFRDDPQRLGRFRQTTKSYVQFCQVTFNKLHWHFEVYQNFEQQKFDFYFLSDQMVLGDPKYISE